MTQIILRVLAGAVALAAFPAVAGFILFLLHYVGYCWETILAVIAVQLGAGKLMAYCGRYALDGAAQ